MKKALKFIGLVLAVWVCVTVVQVIAGIVMIALAL